MDALIVGLLFIIAGVAFFLFVLLKYTEDEHKRELEKWSWFREDSSQWFRDWDFKLFTKIAEKSYIAAKVILLVTALILMAIGVLGLLVYFS